MATATKPTSGNKIAKLTDLYVAPRGRTATLDPSLVKDFEKLAADELIVVTNYGPVVKGKERSSVSQKIRSHWKAAKGQNAECSIRWNTENLPQVFAKQTS